MNLDYSACILPPYYNSAMLTDGDKKWKPVVNKSKKRRELVSFQRPTAPFVRIFDVA